MKPLLLVIFSLFSLLALGQYDTKIVVSVPDTTELRKKVKEAMVKSNFDVKEIGSDTIRTYPRSVNKITGYAVVVAVIENNSVMFYGYYGRLRKDYFGYEKKSKDVHRILRFRGSKTWPILENIASDIGGALAYGQ